MKNFKTRLISMLELAKRMMNEYHNIIVKIALDFVSSNFTKMELWTPVWYWGPIWANNLVTTIETSELDCENQMKNVVEFLIWVSFFFTWCFESFGGLRPNIITPKKIGLDQTLVPKVLSLCLWMCKCQSWN